MPLCFNGKQFPDELVKPEERKAPMMKNPVCKKEKPPPPLPRETQASQPQRFSALLAKYKLQDGIKSDDDCFAGNVEDESDTDTSDNDSDNGDEVYT